MKENGGLARGKLTKQQVSLLLAVVGFPFQEAALGPAAVLLSLENLLERQRVVRVPAGKEMDCA